jgi:hypothetical protein
MTTLPLRRTQRTVVERILGAAGIADSYPVGKATGLLFFMSAILDYSSVANSIFSQAG